MSTPAATIASYIGTNVAALTYNTNIFEGPVRPPSAYIPHNCAFVLTTGGPAPEAFLGETNAWRQFSIQIRVRRNKNDYDGGLTLARSIRDAIHYASIAGYFDVLVTTSDPNYLGQDAEGHHEWSLPATMIIKE